MPVSVVLNLDHPLEYLKKNKAFYISFHTYRIPKGGTQFDFLL